MTRTNNHRGTKTQRFRNKENKVFLLCLCISVIKKS